MKKATKKKQPAKRRKPNETKSEATRRILLQRALALFQEHGVEATTMRDIARAANLSLGAAYYYFPSKEALVFAFYEQNQVEMERLLERAGGTLRERLGTLMHGKLESIRPHRAMLGSIVARLVDPGDPLSAFSAQTRAVREQAIGVFARALEDSVPPHAVPVVANALWLLQLAAMLVFVNDTSARPTHAWARRRRPRHAGADVAAPGDAARHRALREDHRCARPRGHRDRIMKARRSPGTTLAPLVDMATTDMSNKSIPELLSGVLGDAKEIAAGHATKMRGEIKDEFTGLKMFLMKVAIAVGVGILGAILLAHAFALGLDAVGLPQWAAYLIAAALFVAIGIVIVKRLPADKGEIDLVPESTLADFKRDVKSIRRDVKDEVAHVKHEHDAAHAH